MKALIISFVVMLVLAGGYFFLRWVGIGNSLMRIPIREQAADSGQVQPKDSIPLQILEMRKRDYPGSDIKIEETLGAWSNYKRYLVSYQSDGLKIYGLLNVPNGEAPEGGWPAIVFNHGYIPPTEYRTTEKYVAYVDSLARSGFVVFKIDYRGHGGSEGEPQGAYFSPAYTIDALNAFSSLQKNPEVNPKRIGMWGHSLGGNVTLRSMVVNPQVKAGVIWAGVASDYKTMFEKFFSRRPSEGTPEQQERWRGNRRVFIEKYGEPVSNPGFWDSIDPVHFIKDVSGPIQIHHGTADQTVPIALSENLKSALEGAGKAVEYYTYQGADHNISSPGFEAAMQRSIDFFKKNL